MAARDVMTFGFSGQGAATIPMLGFSGGETPPEPEPTPATRARGSRRPSRPPDRRPRRKRRDDEIVLLI
jgi:hypothetical protein